MCSAFHGPPRPLHPCSLVGSSLARCQIYGPSPCRMAASFSANLRPQHGCILLLRPMCPFLEVYALTAEPNSGLSRALQQGPWPDKGGARASCAALASMDLAPPLAGGPSCPVLLSGDIRRSGRESPLINMAPAAPDGILPPSSSWYIKTQPSLDTSSLQPFTSTAQKYRT